MQMTLLNQELAAKHGIYFEDCDTEPGTEWASFLRKSQDKIQQEPWLTLAFSIDYKEGYPGGWSTGSKSVPAGPGVEAPEDPLLKVMRRLDQGALVKRLREGASKDSCPVEDVEVGGCATEVARGRVGSELPNVKGGGMEALIKVGGKDEVRIEEGGGGSQAVGERGENEMPVVERGGNIGPNEEEGVVGEAGASVLDVQTGSEENSNTSWASVGGIKVTSDIVESVEEGEADRDERQHFWTRNEQESVGDLDDGALALGLTLAPTALVKMQLQSQADQLFARELRRLVHSIPAWLETAVENLNGTSGLKLKYHREAIRSVVFIGELVDAWEGDEASVASCVLELYGVPSSWNVHSLPRPKGPVAHSEALEAALQLYTLILIATTGVWVIGADNRALPAPLVPLVKAVGKPLGKGMSPGFFRPAAEAAVALVELCKGSTSPRGVQRALGVITLLKHAPHLSRHLVKPQKGGKAKAGGGSRLDGGDDKPKGAAEKKGKAIVGTSKTDVGREYTDVRPEKTDLGNVKTDMGDVKTDVSAERMRVEDVETKRAAADEAAYEYLEGALAFEQECQSLGEKLAVTAVWFVFNTPSFEV
jgi:hypothetical protein